MGEERRDDERFRRRLIQNRPRLPTVKGPFGSYPQSLCHAQRASHSYSAIAFRAAMGERVGRELARVKWELSTTEGDDEAASSTVRGYQSDQENVGWSGRSEDFTIRVPTDWHRLSLPSSAATSCRMRLVPSRDVDKGAESREEELFGASQ